MAKEGRRQYVIVIVHLISWSKSHRTRWTEGRIVNKVDTNCEIEHHSVLAAVLCDKDGRSMT